MSEDLFDIIIRNISNNSKKSRSYPLTSDYLRAKLFGYRIDQVSKTSFKFVQKKHLEIVEWLKERNIDFDDTQIFLIINLSIDQAVEFKLRFINL